MAFSRYRWLFALAFFILVLDQATKAWIANNLPFPTYNSHGQIDVIPGFFHIVHVVNDGAAWGMFSGYGFWLGILALLTLGLIFVFRRQLALHEPPMQVTFGLLCGGITGNLIDRIWRGHVIDFLDFRLGGYAWPSFNVADSAICVGVFLYILFSFRESQAKPREE